MVHGSITNEKVSDFIFESSKNAAICAGLFAIAPTTAITVTGAALFGAFTHFSDKTTQWIGRQIFDVDSISMARVSSSGWTQQVIHATRLTIQVAAAILVASALTLIAIKASVAYGVTQSTVVALSKVLTFENTTLVTALTLITNFALTALYNEIVG